MVEPPLVGEPSLLVETPAIVEGLGKRAIGLCSLLSQAAKDLLAGILTPLWLSVWFFEIDYSGDVGVEPAALGAYHEHDAALDETASWDSMAITGDPLVSCRKEYRAVEPPAPAGRRQVRGRLVLAHSYLQRPCRLRYRRRGVGPNPPVALQDDRIEDVAQGCDLAQDVQGALERKVRSQRGVADYFSEGVRFVLVPGMLEDLEVRRLLLAHPRRLDVVGQDALHLRGEEDVRDPEGGGVVYPVARPARVPGEVGRSPQQERPQPQPVHHLPDS